MTTFLTKSKKLTAVLAAFTVAAALTAASSQAQAYFYAPHHHHHHHHHFDRDIGIFAGMLFSAAAANAASAYPAPDEGCSYETRLNSLGVPYMIEVCNADSDASAD